MEKLGTEGLNKILSGYDEKSATAVCIYAFQEDPTFDPQLFIGETRGTIVSERKSSLGRNFGWDPIFLPVGYQQTYAEMDDDLKNKISHRAKALEKLKDHFYEIMNDNRKS